MLSAYKIGVEISLINNASMGLAALSQSFNRAQLDATKLEERIASIRRLAIGGGIALGAGIIGLNLFKAPLEEAKKFQQEASKFNTLGFGDAINTQASTFAQGMNTIGTSARQNMAILGDAMAVFKDLNEAKIVAPVMAKMKFVNEAIFGADTGGDRDKKLMDMMKVIEFRGGLSSPAEFTKQANYAQQAIAGSRNRVDPSMMFMALKTGGVALSQRSNEAFYLGAEPLMQEFGGSRYGTAAMSIYQNLVQSRGTITAQQELYRLGLLDKSKVEFNKLGKLKKALPGAFYGSSILEKEGELALLEKVLLPAFQKSGISGDEEVLRELGMILGNRTGSALMSRVYQQRAKLHMQTEANFHAENLDQSLANANKTALGKEIDLRAKLANLELQLGQTILPLYISGIEHLITALKSLSSFMENNKTVVKGLAIAFAGLAAGMAFGGTVLLLKAAFSVLGLLIPNLTLGIGASTVALNGLAVAAGAFAAAYAGWKAGGWLNDHVINPAVSSIAGHKTTLGSALYDFMHPEGPGNGDNGQYISLEGRAKPWEGDVYLDGKKVGAVMTPHVTKEQSKQANRPQQGTTRHDGNMSMSPVGAHGGF